MPIWTRCCFSAYFLSQVVSRGLMEGAKVDASLAFRDTCVCVFFETQHLLIERTQAKHASPAPQGKSTRSLFAPNAFTPLGVDDAFKWGLPLNAPSAAAAADGGDTASTCAASCLFTLGLLEFHAARAPQKQPSVANTAFLAPAMARPPAAAVAIETMDGHAILTDLLLAFSTQRVTDKELTAAGPSAHVGELRRLAALQRSQALPRSRNTLWMESAMMLGKGTASKDVLSVVVTAELDGPQMQLNAALIPLTEDFLRAFREMSAATAVDSAMLSPPRGAKGPPVAFARAHSRLGGFYDHDEEVPDRSCVI